MLAGNTYGSVSYGGSNGFGPTINFAHDNVGARGSMSADGIFGGKGEIGQLGSSDIDHILGDQSKDSVSGSSINNNNLGEI